MAPTGPRERSPHAHPAVYWSNWNLLLLLPLITLATPLFNMTEPRLLGFPAFYWMQFMFIPLSVLCTALVYRMTRNVGGPRERNVGRPASEG